MWGLQSDATMAGKKVASFAQQSWDETLAKK